MLGNEIVEEWATLAAPKMCQLMILKTKDNFRRGSHSFCNHP
jgi:hypothetical protein